MPSYFGRYVFLMIVGMTIVFFNASCATPPQVFSTPQYQALALNSGDLEKYGLAFITPTTASGFEEDKQALAFSFVEVLINQRPQIRCMKLSETLGLINSKGLSTQYRFMLEEYSKTGMFPYEPLKNIGEASGVRYIGQLKLAAFDQSYDIRLSLFGFRLLGTKYTNMRVFFQIWDSHTGAIAWEGGQEVSFAIDALSEKTIPFKIVVDKTAKKLIENLP